MPVAARDVATVGSNKQWHSLQASMKKYDNSCLPTAIGIALSIVLLGSWFYSVRMLKAYFKLPVDNGVIGG